MGGTARPLHDPGNDGTVERRSLRQAARRGRLTSPANPVGDLERPRALTPPPGARSVGVIAVNSPRRRRLGDSIGPRLAEFAAFAGFVTPRIVQLLNTLVSTAWCLF